MTRCSATRALPASSSCRRSAADSTHIYNQYVIRCPSAIGFARTCRRTGIGTEVYYPLPLHLQPCFRRARTIRAGRFRRPRRRRKKSLALPIYGELTEAQQSWVVESISRIFSTRA